jgi:single-strand DNA-binding protein
MRGQLTMLDGRREGGGGGGYGGGDDYGSPAPARAPAGSAGGFGNKPAGGFDDMDDDVPF